MAISSFLIPHPAPRSPLPPQALRHVGRTQPPGCSRTGCSTPSTRLCHCLPSQAWSPRPQQNTWPKYPVFKGGRVNVGWDWGTVGWEHLGKPSESQGKHTGELLLPGIPRSSWQNCFSHPCFHPPFPLPASFENPTSQNIILPFLLQLPCESAAGSLSSTQKHSMV